MYSVSKHVAFTYIGSVVMLLCVFILLPATAQDVRVAYQSEDAGESVDDDPEDTGEPVVVEESADDEATETLTPAERAASLDRRAGEQVGDDPRGRAMILGMHIQEGDSGRAKVVEVGAASPAFDAGIREGDEIISFEGFTGKSYRQWIDGIRKLATDTPDGEIMTVDVLRNGKRVSTKVMAPEAKADDPRVPGVLGQRIEETTQVGVVPAGQPVAPTAGGDNDVFISNGPLFGNEFDDAFSGATDRAMAEIRRLTEPQQTAKLNRTARANSPAARRAGVPEPQPGAPPAPGVGATASARIGLAGFRDDQNGLMVMLDVGGLAPGSYRVSIDDPSLVMGGAQPTGTAVPPQSQQQQPTNDEATDIAFPAERSVATSGLETLTPPTGEVDPESVAPAAGRNLPPGSTATGLPDAQEAAATQPAQQAAQTAGAAGAFTSTLSEVGVLTVDQSGTGRLQQVVEGVQVRDVVGQAILIYSPASPPETTVPPNTNVSGVVGRAAPAGTGGATRPANQQRTANSQQTPGQPQQPLNNTAQTSGQANMPVAGGVIRLMSDRRPQGADRTATAEATVPQASGEQDPQLEQPNASTGAAPEPQQPSETPIR